MRVTVRGGEDLARISRQLRHVGNGREIKKQFTKELRSAARPMVAAVKSSIMNIPSKGQGTGLRRRMARATGMRVRTSGKKAEVAILVDGRKMPTGERALPAYMEGTKKPWRHPVFGNTNAWVQQQPAHPYFFHTVRVLGPRSRRAVNKAIDQITRDIT